MTITSLMNEVAGAELQPIVHQAIAENNSVLAGCNVHSLFRQSVVDLETGRHGLRWLIARILSERNAVLPRVSSKYTGENRHLYIALGMTTDDIISKVREINGFDKYPDSTISDTLCIVMRRSNQVAFIEQTSTEDYARTCNRPRHKWYYVAE